jgi:hypothetical protein
MTTTDATTSTPARRSVGLRTTLTLIAFVSVFGLGKALFERASLLAAFRDLTPALLNTMIAIVAAVLACVAAVWFGRRWGVWLGLALVGCEFAIELYIGVPWSFVLRWPATLVLLALFVRPQWAQYK